MTSIEWLWEQIDGIIPYQDIKTSQLFNGVLDQAKEMHKQEIIDAWNGGDYAYFYSKETGRDFADGNDYYQETFVSKGSGEVGNAKKVLSQLKEFRDSLTDEEKKNMFKDDHIVDSNEMVDVPQHPSVISENGNELLFDEEGNLIKENQQEISDEEIEKAFKDASERLSEYKEGLIDGAKWYREQLKQRQ